MNLYVYRRVSTTKQAKEEKDSLKIQVSEKVIETLCAEHSLNNVVEMVTVGSAYKKTHINKGQPLKVFIDEAKQGLHKGILAVYSLDRLSRMDFADARDEIYNPILAAGISIYSEVDNHLYTRGDLKSSIMADLIFSRANEESETKKKRVNAAISSAITRFKETGEFQRGLGKCPAYIDSATGKLNHRADMYRYIVEAIIAGERDYTITKHVNSVAEWTKNSKGDPWSEVLVSKIRQAPSYLIGQRTISTTGDVLDNFYEPLIDLTTYNKLKNFSKVVNRTSVNRETLYLLSGLVKCPHCNSSVVSYVNNTSGYKISCRKQIKRVCSQKTRETYNLNTIEAIVCALTYDYLDSRKNSEANKQHAADLAKAEADIEKLQADILAISDELDKGFSATLSEALRKYEERHKAACSLRDSLLATTEYKDTTLTEKWLVEALSDCAITESRQKLKELLLGVVKEIRITRKEWDEDRIAYIESKYGKDLYKGKGYSTFTVDVLFVGGAERRFTTSYVTADLHVQTAVYSEKQGVGKNVYTLLRKLLDEDARRGLIVSKGNFKKEITL